MKIIDNIYKLYMRKKFIKYIKGILNITDFEFFDYLHVLGAYNDIEKFVEYYKLNHSNKSIQFQIDRKNITVKSIFNKEININFTNNNHYDIKMKQIDRKVIHIIYQKLKSIYKESIKIKKECNKYNNNYIKNINDIPKDIVLYTNNDDNDENNI